MTIKEVVCMFLIVLVAVAVYDKVVKKFIP